MFGENVHGRTLSNALTKNGIEHTCLIEKHTQRSIDAEKWLDPDYGSEIASNMIFTKDLFGSNGIKILSQIEGYAINGGGLPILDKKILALPSKGFLNVHPGILPNYRGLDPVKWSISNQDPLGATLHVMDEGIDTGPILIKEELESFKSNTIKGIRLEILELGADLLVKFLLNPEHYTPQEQKKENGAYYSAYMNGDENEAETKLKKFLKSYPLNTL